MEKDIITLPDIRLRQKAKKVHVITEEVQGIIEKMRAASLDWENNHPHEMSAAMAAPQIGEALKIVIVRDNLDDKDDKGFTALINPEVVKLEGTIAEDYEGCLSVPGVYGLIERNTKVRIRAITEEGHEVRLKLVDSLARTLLHEIDHLNGVLFIDYIKDREDAFFELDKDGELQPLDYEKDIKNNKVLWGDA